jgi:hypothetical protein
MAFGFNPFTGNFDLTGGGDAAPFAGQVDAYADLPLDSTAALNSRWLVKNNSGTWPLSTYKQAGIYIRVSTVGASRDTDYQFVGTLPSVMNDNEFLIYDDTDATKNLKFNVGANVPTASTVTLTAPSASGTLGFLQSVSSITVSTDHQLTAARNQRVLVNSTGGGSGTAVYLPATGNAEGDRLEVACVGLTSGTLSVRTGQYDFTVSTSMGLNEQRTLIYTAGAWTVGAVESHTHSGLGPTFASSAFRVTEPSGLVTNSLAFSLSGITAGSTRTLTVPDASGRIQVEGQPIGNTTPAAGSFTTLSASDALTASNATASPPSTLAAAKGVQWSLPASSSAAIAGIYPGSAAISLLTGHPGGMTENARFSSSGIAFNSPLTAAAGTFTTLTANNGTLTASAPALDVAQTWNNSGTTFTALRINVTNTSSVTTSLLADFQVGGVSSVAIRRDGRVVCVQLQATSLVFSGGDVQCATAGGFYWASNDLFLVRDAANTLAQRNATNAQEFRLYGTHTGTTNYQRLAIKTKAVTLSALSGASVATTTGFIPDGAVLVGLTTRVSTAITGATGYDIGDGTDADRWGTNIGIALNTSSDNRDWTAGTIECFTTAQEVTLTAVGSNFTGGAVVIVAHYLAGEAD